MVNITYAQLDQNYHIQLNILEHIRSEHGNKTDFAICDKWINTFNNATGINKLARNCLLLLMYSQLYNDECLSKPFTDMRNCKRELKAVLEEFTGNPLPTPKEISARQNALDIDELICSCLCRGKHQSNNLDVDQNSVSECEDCDEQSLTEKVTYESSLNSHLKVKLAQGNVKQQIQSAVKDISITEGEQIKQVVNELLIKLKSRSIQNQLKYDKSAENKIQPYATKAITNTDYMLNCNKTAALSMDPLCMRCQMQHGKNIDRNIKMNQQPLPDYGIHTIYQKSRAELFAQQSSDEELRPTVAPNNDGVHKLQEQVDRVVSWLMNYQEGKNYMSEEKLKEKESTKPKLIAQSGENRKHEVAIRDDRMRKVNKSAVQMSNEENPRKVRHPNASQIWSKATTDNSERNDSQNEDRMLELQNDADILVHKKKKTSRTNKVKHKKLVGPLIHGLVSLMKRTDDDDDDDDDDEVYTKKQTNRVQGKRRQSTKNLGRKKVQIGKSVELLPKIRSEKDKRRHLVKQRNPNVMHSAIKMSKDVPQQPDKDVIMSTKIKPDEDKYFRLATQPSWNELYLREQSGDGIHRLLQDQLNVERKQNSKIQAIEYKTEHKRLKRHSMGDRSKIHFNRTQSKHKMNQEGNAIKCPTLSDAQSLSDNAEQTQLISQPVGTEVPPQSLVTKATQITKKPEVCLDKVASKVTHEANASEQHLIGNSKSILSSKSITCLKNVVKQIVRQESGFRPSEEVVNEVCNEILESLLVKNPSKAEIVNNNILNDSNGECDEITGNVSQTPVMPISAKLPDVPTVATVKDTQEYKKNELKTSASYTLSTHAHGAIQGTSSASTINSSNVHQCSKTKQNCKICELQYQNEKLEMELIALQKENLDAIRNLEQTKHLNETTIEQNKESLKEYKKELVEKLVNSINMALERFEKFSMHSKEEPIHFLSTIFQKLFADNHDEFRRQIIEYDTKLEDLLRIALDAVAKNKEKSLRQDIEKKLNDKYLRKRERVEQRLQLQIAAEHQHLKLCKLMNMSLLKKLVLEHCRGKLDRCDFVLLRLDKEYEKIYKDIQ